ncbi:hypothetical protein PLESTF_001682400 [Pleodorina starrii]|nr:hypothetical protein PLESTF_001682400 [Pleodorina starrii]
MATNAGDQEAPLINDAGSSSSDEHVHYIHRAPWLRAFILGANDGLVSAEKAPKVSVAALMLGVGGGSESLSTMRLAGVASWIAGALSMAVGEYISVASQRDTEEADIEKERQQQLRGPVARARELMALIHLSTSPPSPPSGPIGPHRLRGPSRPRITDRQQQQQQQQRPRVHIRLMATRGLKPTPYQNPDITIGQPTIVIIPEYKEPSPVPREVGIRLFTVHVRRGAPDVQDPGWNSHSKLNCIAACIQANKAGADEALMLDPQGFVATCNSTNFFIVRKGEVYSADEAFVTGTFAGVIPVVAVDGRTIGSGSRGPLATRLQTLYTAFVDSYCAGGPEDDVAAPAAAAPAAQSSSAKQQQQQGGKGCGGCADVASTGGKASAGTAKRSGGWGCGWRPLGGG